MTRIEFTTCFHEFSMYKYDNFFHQYFSDEKEKKILNVIYFTIVGDLVIKPNWARNLDEEYYSAKFEEDNLNTKIANCKLCSNYILLTPISSPEGRMLRNGEILAYYEKTRNEVRDKRQNLDKARQTSMWRRVLGKNLVL